MKGFMISAFAAQLACGEVVELTPDNFDQITGKGKALVKFFAPWCGHCKNMAPHYIADSEKLEEGVVLAEVDCDKDSNKALCEKNEIRGFPTLKWFDADGSVTEYDGGRGAGSFSSWTADMVKPVVQNVTAIPQNITDRMEITLSATEMSEDFEKAAKANRKHAKFNFMEVEAGWFGGSAQLTLTKADGEKVESTDVSVEAINKLVSDHRFPLFGELNGETYGDYTSREGRDMLWTLLKHDEGKLSESVEAIRGDIEALAKENDKFSFTFTDTVQFAQPIEGMLGIKTEHLPCVVVQRGKNKFVMRDQEVNKENVDKFLKGIESGEVQFEVKSEDVPEKNDGPVRTVVATTMEQELFSDEKDVLVKVYAPWCGHCKTMAPEYEAAGKELKESGLDSKVVLAELDGSANDSTIDSMEWQGFPTLFFIKKGTKTPMPYDGPRDKVGILEWIKKNSDQDLAVDTEAILEKDAAPTEEL